MKNNRIAYSRCGRQNARSTGFTLVELLVVISIISILAGLLFKRVQFYQEMAEKAAMQQVVGALQSGLILQFAHQLTLGTDINVKYISNENPIEFLMQKPANYVGELSGIHPDSVPPGNWAYDKLTSELIYVPDHSEFFEPAKDGKKWIRFKTKFVYTMASGYKSKRNGQLAGVTLAPVEPYIWIIKEGET